MWHFWAIYKVYGCIFQNLGSIIFGVGDPLGFERVFKCGVFGPIYEIYGWLSRRLVPYMICLAMYKV